MKIFNAVQIKEADNITLANQGITSLELMERAATEVFLWLKRKFPDKETLFHVFCGRGNNGGDGLVVARLLHEDGYIVVVDIVEEAGKPTADFKTNLAKLDDIGIECNTGIKYDYKKGKLVVIDALFGIGLTRELAESVKEVIEKINSDACVISIDVPSGMFLDKKTDFAIRSDIVLTFQFSKLAFYISGNYRFIKDVVVLDIGLDKDFIRNTATTYYHTGKFDIYSHYKPVHPYAHKGTQGHALLIGGSYGKIGAVTLAAKGALKSGCGLVTAFIPKCGYTVLQSAFPEAMVLTDGDEYITNINFDLNIQAIGIGVGIGQHPETQQAVLDFLKHLQVPAVIDADGLNILSYNKDMLKALPRHTILTPHPKELERLMGSWEDDFDKIEKMKAFAKEHDIILISKDANTFVVFDGAVHINSTGNAALATGGSGDVLTGIITGLLAQGYTPPDAAIFGVYLHGLTANIGVAETGVQAFTASNILEYIGKAFLKMEADHAQR